MFVSQAHSFSQQAKLAITLAWVAGYTNVLTILTCHEVTSHASGTVSKVGEYLSDGNWQLAGYALFLIVSFLGGAFLSGICTEFGRWREWESIYVLPMIVEAAMLFLFAIGLGIHGETLAEQGAILFWLTGTAAAAMGLQNATITHISKGVVRTTHVTGVLTDFGLETAHLLWMALTNSTPHEDDVKQPNAMPTHIPPTWRRVALLGAILLTFALGGGLGTLAHRHIQRWSMFIPVAFLVWVIYQDLVRPIAEIEVLNLNAGPSDFQLPKSLAVYHLGKDHERDGKRHRLPNLLDWADRLAAETKVIILDLGDAVPLDENGLLELSAVLLRLLPEGRHLIVAGINADHYRRLRQAGLGEHLQLDHICPDLELAIARGLSLIHTDVTSAG